MLLSTRLPAVDEAPGARPVSGPVDPPGLARPPPPCPPSEKVTSFGLDCRPAPPVAGIAVLRDQVRPPSAVLSTDPSSSTRYPAWSAGKSNAATFAEQRRSVAVHGSRVNVWPPSSERRSAHSPPMTTESVSIRLMRSSGSVSPVAEPRQVVPPSSVRDERPEPARAIPARSLELERLDRLALRSRVAPRPPRVADADRGLCGRRGDTHERRNRGQCKSCSTRRHPRVPQSSSGGFNSPDAAELRYVRSAC